MPGGCVACTCTCVVGGVGIDVATGVPGAVVGASESADVERLNAAIGPVVAGVVGVVNAFTVGPSALMSDPAVAGAGVVVVGAIARKIELNDGVLVAGAAGVVVGEPRRKMVDTAGVAGVAGVEPSVRRVVTEGGVTVVFGGVVVTVGFGSAKPIGFRSRERTITTRQRSARQRNQGRGRLPRPRPSYRCSISPEPARPPPAQVAPERPKFEAARAVSTPAREERSPS